MIRVGVNGAAGGWAPRRAHAVAGDPDLELVAAVEPTPRGRMVEGSRSPATPSAFRGCFAATSSSTSPSRPPRARRRAAAARPWHPRRGRHDRAQRRRPRRVRGRLRRRGCRQRRSSPPTSPSRRCVLMRLAEIAAPFFDTVEIIELHHDRQDRRALRHRRSPRPSASPPRRATWAPDPTTTRGAPRRPRRRPGPGRDPPPLGAHARDGGAPGGDLRGAPARR